MRNRTYLTLAGLIAVVCSFQNCSPAAFHQTAASTTNALGNPAPVCNPFSSTPTQQGHGLQATLHYLTSDQIRAENTAMSNKQTYPYNNFSDIYNMGNGHVTNPILIGDLNVPDRFFTSGMTDANGNAVSGSDGSIVTQYFGFIANGQLILGNLAPGDYEIATITDDGSILTIQNGSRNSNGTYSDIVINNDGLHSAQMGCTSQIIHLDATSAYNLTLDYIQGPPVTIALIMLLRPHPSSGYVADAQCNQGGSNDTYFFQDNDGAKPTPHPIYPVIEQQPYKDVLSRNWVPVGNANLLLPPNSTVQGCN